MKFSKKSKEFIFYNLFFRFIPRRLKFKLIHKYNLWASNESVSGPGSEISKTRNIIPFLEKILIDFHIKSMLDIPCGDFNWMKNMKLRNVEYTGADIVGKIIIDNKKNYNSPNRKFVLLDIIRDPLPYADLILVRDVFIHFSLRNVQLSLNNIKKTGFTYILLSTYPETKKNINIKDGYNFNINMEIEPFNFKKPILLFEEEKLPEPYGRKCLGLWKVNDLYN